jgi:hypothetical protein
MMYQPATPLDALIQGSMDTHSREERYAQQLRMIARLATEGKHDLEDDDRERVKNALQAIYLFAVGALREG